jgi:uncharacterized protein (TIGR02246 family)
MSSRKQKEEHFIMTSTQTAPGVETVVSAVVNAWNRHDMKAFSAQFTEDADFVNVLGMHFLGRPQIEAVHIDLHRTIFKNSMIRAVSTTVRPLNGQFALAHVAWEMTGAGSLPGWNVPELRKGMLSLVLVRAGDRWLITAAQNTEAVPLELPKP